MNLIVMQCFCNLL